MNTGLEAIMPAEICRGLFCVSGLGCLFGVGGVAFFSDMEDNETRYRCGLLTERRTSCEKPL